MKKIVTRSLILGILVFLQLSWIKLVDANTTAPIISGGNAVTSNDDYYYGHTDPGASVSYNAFDVDGNRMVIGAGKANDTGDFKIKLNHKLRTGLYTWVYVTSNQGANKGMYSVYDRVIDGTKYFDTKDPANVTALAKQTSAEFSSHRRNTTSLGSSMLINKNYSDFSKASSVVTDQLQARSQESYPYGNLFTTKATDNVAQATPNSALVRGEWGAKGDWIPIFRTPQSGISVNWNNNKYNIGSQQGIAISSDGSYYIVYDNDNDTTNSGAFVMRISAAYAQYLADTPGNTQVEGKSTPVWLDQDGVESALDSGNIAFSEIFPAQHGATLSIWNNAPYLMSGIASAQTLYKLNFAYAKAKQTGTPYSASTQNWDGNNRTVITSTSLGTSTFLKNDGKTVASGVSQMPKNLAMVSANTGYFVIPYSESNGNQNSWYGYALYQIKGQGSSLVITQSPLILQSMLGDSGKGVDPVQAISYDHASGDMIITSNDAYMQFSLADYVEKGNSLLGMYNKVSYTDSKGNPASFTLNVKSERFFSDNNETEQIIVSPNGEKYVMGNADNIIYKYGK